MWDAITWLWHLIFHTQAGIVIMKMVAVYLFIRLSFTWISRVWDVFFKGKA